jgi:hypothetical protein
MNASSLFFRDLNPVRRTYIFGSVVACVLVVGIFAEELIAYICITVPCLLPLFLWLRAGATGIPVLPTLSAVFFVYYAVPLLRNNITIFGSDELFAASVSVGGFLIAASAASWPFLRAARKPLGASATNFISYAEVTQIIHVGLACGILFHLATITGVVNGLGSSVGIVRSIVLTLSSVACYLLGCARASHLLVGTRWGIAAGGFCALIVLSLSNLFLIGGAMNCLAALLGYILTSKRVPWLTLVSVFALLSVLHAGKFEMRERYWMPSSQVMQESSVGDVPGMLVDWLALGAGALVSGRAKSDVMERASLLHMVLLVHRATPNFIPYLEGQTYTMLPLMLVPRVLNPGKAENQAVLNFLSKRYGLQYEGSSGSTTIGWGMVAEAYANLGDEAVIAVGAIFGFLCGGLTRLSSGATPLSLPMLVAIAATLTLFNLELDLSYLVATLAQAITAVFIFAGLMKLFRRRGHPRLGPTNGVLSREVPAFGPENAAH